VFYDNNYGVTMSLVISSFGIDEKREIKGLMINEFRVDTKF
jgi:hypothetical protein